MFEKVFEVEEIKEPEPPEIKAIREAKVQNLLSQEQKFFERNQKNETNLAEIQKKQKDLESKIKTADADGNLILIKHTLPEKLNPDFISPLPIVTARPPSVSDVKELHDPIVLKHGVKAKEKTESKDEGKLANYLSSNKKKTKKENSVQVTNFQTSKVDSTPIIPAGSCYDTFYPEIGVTLVEPGKQPKEGGEDFLLSFKKYSKKEYEKMLRDIIGINTLKGTMEQMMGQTMDEGESKDTILPDINLKTKTQAKDMGSPSNRSGFSKANDTIKFNKTQGASLRKAIEGIMHEDSSSTAQPFIPNMTGKTASNIFKSIKGTKDKIKEEHQKMAQTHMEQYEKKLNSLTQTITGSAWGTQTKKEEYNRTLDFANLLEHKKPNPKELEKEIGKNAWLPRSRQKAKLQTSEKTIISISKKSDGKKPIKIKTN